ncbi:GIY-YIG catalytic domain-containing endonuclease [Paramecium bursaria Chlorella virus Can18-4]|nr:GIY-YIG catalytic domain-containing endonuclease [Paramecium bursaria Chlorella virus Can18-4]
MGFIYKATYRGSGKAYIGQTTQPILDRLEQHQKPSSGCRAFYDAIQKHGWENFDKEWYEVPDEDLNFYEEMLVALLGTLAPGGYNLKEGGGADGKMSEETKKKMSEAHAGEKHHMYGKNHTEETKQKISESMSGEKSHMYGKTLSEETKKKMSESQTGEKNPMYGKTHTEETKKILSKSLTGEKNHNSKRVYQYTTDGTYIDAFASSGEAARSLNKSDGSLIRTCARGKCKDAYGFKWSRELL